MQEKDSKSVETKLNVEKELEIGEQISDCYPWTTAGRNERKKEVR